MSIEWKFVIEMELILHRRFLGKEYTIGSLYLSHPSPQERGMDAEVIANVLSHDSGDDNVETQCIASLQRTDTDAIANVSLPDNRYL
jgi:hypothetical protein